MSGRPSCVLLGGGGHARVLIDSLRQNGVVAIVGILDRDRSLWGSEVFGVPILGGDDLLPKLIDNGSITRFAIGVGGTGDNRPRRALFEAARSTGLLPLTIIHPQAIVSPQAVLEVGSQVLPGAIVNAGARIGPNAIVNSGAIIEHDCQVGGHAHVASGARLASTVRIGEGAHVGAGATIRQCLSVGDYAIVGAGAVVVKDVPAGAVVAGVPARPLERRKP